MFSKMSISEDSEPERSDHEFIRINNNSLFFPNEPTKQSNSHLIPQYGLPCENSIIYNSNNFYK